MLNYILSIIGFVLIGFSIFIINKDLKKTDTKLSNINEIEENVKGYYKLTEEMIETFDEVIGNKIEQINNEKINNPNMKIQKDNLQMKIFTAEDNIFNKDFTDSTMKKIIELQSIGLTKEEIAKKLNKGIRELEIIMKIHDLKNRDKNIQK